MRFFVKIAYRGTSFAGWQSQQSGVHTIQETIEQGLSRISGSSKSIIGCGRTDTGVHASEYYFHVDSEMDLAGKEFQLNAVCGHEIAIKKIIRVHDDAHARFDATMRAYEYHMHTYKDPFLRGLSFHFKDQFDFDLCKEAAQLILNFQDFTTFCKSNSDVNHKRCTLHISEWEEINPGQYVYKISANRFLRGMVRLIVGMCLNVGKGKLSLEEVRDALERKSILNQAWSVPAQGLYLSKITYPFDLN